MAGRMENARLSDQMLLGGLKHGKRKQSKPKKRWNDCVREDIQKLDVSETCYIYICTG